MLLSSERFLIRLVVTAVRQFVFGFVVTQNALPRIVTCIALVRIVVAWHWNGWCTIRKWPCALSVCQCVVASVLVSLRVNPELDLLTLEHWDLFANGCLEIKIEENFDPAQRLRVLHRFFLACRVVRVSECQLISLDKDDESQ